MALEITYQKGKNAANDPFETNILAFGSTSMAAYLDWQYLPVVTAVYVSVLWETVDITVRHLEPFYQLSEPNGACIKDSLSMDCIAAFNFFVPFEAAYHCHLAVALSSLVYFLSFGVLPTLAG